ncbi:hypothetical protein Krac_1699 [Ktedonobacter racemifer DSM 44963]|uniref:Uncharacterized protein n=1 Tax=Ktedonobacter racemifer DSM 44963 TaxID=485913 RepID=D6U2R9_KTERA|nr:hypothetical protein Krac_1699 [Ktedonobacter racemifer DSM 44963]
MLFRASMGCMGISGTLQWVRLRNHGYQLPGSRLLQCNLSVCAHFLFCPG